MGNKHMGRGSASCLLNELEHFDIFLGNSTKPTQLPSRSTLRYLSKGNESVCLHIDLHSNIYDSFICNEHKLKITNVCII